MSDGADGELETRIVDDQPHVMCTTEPGEDAKCPGEHGRDFVVWCDKQTKGRDGERTVVQCTEDLHMAYPNFSFGNPTILRNTTGGVVHGEGEY